MPMRCLDTDLAAVFDTRDFARDDATWRGIIIAGIFDDEDVEVQTGEGVAEIMPQATFTTRTDDLPGIQEGDVVRVGLEQFVVKFWTDDGSGVTTIYLTRP